MNVDIESNKQPVGCIDPANMILSGPPMSLGVQHCVEHSNSQDNDCEGMNDCISSYSLLTINFAVNEVDNDMIHNRSLRLDMDVSQERYGSGIEFETMS